MDGQQARAGDGAHRGERLTPRPRPTATPYTSYNAYPICRMCYVWGDSGLVIVDGNKEGTAYSVPIIP